MKGESQMWAALRPVLAGWKLDCVRIETPARDGIPDVNYTFGWIELKNVEDWPKKQDTPLRVDHFTVEQRAWLFRRWMSGGLAFLLLRVRKPSDWLLFDGLTASNIVGKVSKNELFRSALIATNAPTGLSVLRTWRCRDGSEDPRNHRFPNGLPRI